MWRNSTTNMQFSPTNGDFTFVSSTEAEGRLALAEQHSQQARASHKPVYVFLVCHKVALQPKYKCMHVKANTYSWADAV